VRTKINKKKSSCSFVMLGPCETLKIIQLKP
jgi:hypothetical protein